MGTDENLKMYSDESIFAEAIRRKKGQGPQPNSNGEYPVVCSECKKDTTVRFKPRGDWPVYCYDCYMKRKGGP